MEPAERSAGSGSVRKNQKLAPYLLVGLAQGVALWALHESGQRNVWPATDPTALAALTHFFVAGPLAWLFLGASLADARTRTIASALVGLLMGALGGHAAASGAPGTTFLFSFALASAILSYVVIALVGGFDISARQFVYTRLFEVSWRNALVGIVAQALTGILWLLLWAAAWMMSAIGIEAPSTVLKEPATVALVTCTGFAIAVCQALNRADALVALRRFWLALNAWFLPLCLLLALLWLGSLTATGTELLFATRRAALYLFWFVALAILFMNAAFQDGNPTAYPPKVAAAIRFAWLAIPILAAIGLWALALRVRQHGWTVERIWAAFVGGMATLYAVGYSIGAIGRQRWMAAVAPTNVLAAVVLCFGIGALVSPAADARKLAVKSQVSRLLDGRTSPDQFDFRFLKTSAGRYGTEALERLANDPQTIASVNALAAAALRADANSAIPRQNPSEALSILRSRVPIVPDGSAVDPELLTWLARSHPDYNEQMCIANPAHCALWVIDLDRSGRAQAVLLSEQHSTVTATLYARDAEGWRRHGNLIGPPLPLSAWLDVIRSGKATTVSPRWPDIQIGERRYSVR